MKLKVAPGLGGVSPNLPPQAHTHPCTSVQSVAGIARELYDGFVAELRKIAGSSLDHRRAGDLGDPTVWVRPRRSHDWDVNWSQ